MNKKEKCLVKFSQLLNLFSFSLAIGVLVVLLLICTRVDSPLCKICEEKTTTAKVLIPIADEKNAEKSSSAISIPMASLENPEYE